MRRHTVIAWLIVLAVGLGTGPRGMAAPVPKTVEVGQNAACDFDNIEDAIAAANPGDTIRVQNLIYLENPLVVSKNLTLKGSYAQAGFPNINCLTNTGVAWTIVRPAGATTAPLLSVQNATVTVTWIKFESNSGHGIEVQDGVLNLENVVVRNNSVGSGGVGGGLNVVRSTANLVQTEIAENRADWGGGLYIDQSSTVNAHGSSVHHNGGRERGGGVYVTGGSSFAALEGTEIKQNVANLGCEDGGGIYATGAGTEVTIDASQVLTNTALTRGGGLYVGGGADAAIENWSAVQANGAYGPSLGAGGGIHVSGAGSTLHVSDSFIDGNWSDPLGAGIYNDGGTVHLSRAYVMNNDADDYGGGLYNTGGVVAISNSLFYRNEIHKFHGGGLYSSGNNGSLDIEAGWFLQNTSPVGDGGAIYASHPQTSVRRSFFGQNSAINGSALFLSGACCTGNPVAEVVNSYIVDNPRPASSRTVGPQGSGSSLYAEGIQANLAHNTFAHQSLLDAFGVHAGDGSNVHMTNNILTNFEVGIRRLSGGTGTVVASYTLFHNNTNNYDPSGVSSTHERFGDPAFAGPGNYHLTETSAAINQGAAAGVTTDWDGDLRPWGGGYDIGADEYPPQWQVFLPLALSGN